MAVVINGLIEVTKYTVALPLMIIYKLGQYGLEETDDENYGYFKSRRIYKFFWFCFWTALFITIFAVGGIITVFIGMVYAYLAIYRKVKCINSKVPDKSCDL
jgi:ABC-type Fe3+ transport system permease subunit